MASKLAGHVVCGGQGNAPVSSGGRRLHKPARDKTVQDRAVHARDSNVNFLLLIAFGITVVVQHGTLRESG